MGGKISRLPLNRRRLGRRRRIIRLPSLGARLKRRLEKVIEAVFSRLFCSVWKCGHYCLLRLLPETAATLADRISCLTRKFRFSHLRHLQIFEVEWLFFMQNVGVNITLPHCAYWIVKITTPNSEFLLEGWNFP